jgi:hypothetical protein
MRLVTVEGTANTWAWLEAETHAEAQALSACAARGEWTNGRGSDAMARLCTLADRLGYPVRDPHYPIPTGSNVVVVRRGARDLFTRLTAIARPGTVVWDRRVTERRTADRPGAVNRRRHDRRQATPRTWVTQDYLVAPLTGTGG